MKLADNTEEECKNQMKKDFLFDIFKKALSKINVNDGYHLFFEEPKNTEHGDLATNIAMQLAKQLKQPPRQIAQSIIDNIEYDINDIEKIEIAGPGFINIQFTKSYYQNVFKNIVEFGENFGKNNNGNGKKVNIEYVSANPTGLLHLGHGRNACIGDTVANLYEWNGWEVTREYYFNNAGNQMNILGKSVYARYMQSIKDKDFPFPEDGYHGDYVKIIAEQLIAEYGDKLAAGRDEDLKLFRAFAEKWCFDKILTTMKTLNVHHDVYFNESSLYDEGKIDVLIEELKSKGLAYEKDGALWLTLTKLGMESDRVIVKSTGEPTYRLPDIAYHIDKFKRGFDLLVDVFGADHIATYPDVIAGLKALGYDAEKIQVLIYQFVTLSENGKQIKMSKRTGKSYTLDELIEEVGADVVRFFFIMRSISTHLDFDLAIAREQSEKNPVFYLQYAHARICSVIDKAKEQGISINQYHDVRYLNEKQELLLIKILAKFPDVVKSSCEKSEPQILADYLRDLASTFHIFYHDCRIIGSDDDIRNARLALIDTTRIAMRNGLKILGINAPERM